MLRIVEDLTGKQVPQDILEKIVQGPKEEDLVNSGLEETMINAYQQIREIRKQHNDEISLRTAAFINALDKIAISYLELGIFP